MTSTVNPDYWSLLGIDPSSDMDQLKVAFRREARRWHPDLNGNNLHAEERFKLINEAYAVLSDPKKREIWEKSISFQNQSAEPFTEGFPEFSDYLELVLGIKKSNEDIQQDEEETIPQSNVEWPATSPKSPPPVQIYDDLETLLELTPDEALNGATIELELEDGTLVEVETPPLAGDGWRLRLAGVAKGGRDHFLQLRVQTEDGLRIDGLRVLYRLELLPPDAVLGCAVDVPTLSGTVTLQVPPKSSSGRLLRLRGRGLKLDDRVGDQIVEIVVVIPANLGEAERALYTRLQELSLDPEPL